MPVTINIIISIIASAIAVGIRPLITHVRERIFGINAAITIIVKIRIITNPVQVCVAPFKIVQRELIVLARVILPVVVIFFIPFQARFEIGHTVIIVILIRVITYPVIIRIQPFVLVVREIVVGIEPAVVIIIVIQAVRDAVEIVIPVKIECYSL